MPNSGMSDFWANKILNKTFNGAAITYPSSFFIALYTAEPSGAGGGSQVNGGGYSRVEIPVDAAHFAATTTREIVNAQGITFPTASAAWGSIVAWGLFDALVNGNLYYFGAISPNKAVGVGDSPSIAVGQMKVRHIIST